MNRFNNRSDIEGKISKLEDKLHKIIKNSAEM